MIVDVAVSVPGACGFPKDRAPVEAYLKFGLTNVDAIISPKVVGDVFGTDASGVN